MTATHVQIISPQTVPATVTTLYTSTSLTTQINNLTFTNTSTSPVQVTLYLVPSGGTAGVTNQISQKTVTPGPAWQCPEWIGKTMKSGDTIQAIAGTSGVIVASGSGVQYS